MNTDQFLSLSLLAVMLILFIWERWRYDIVALLGLLIAYFLGLVDTPDLFSGFGHPAVITVAFVLILSYGLSSSGAMEGLSGLLIRFSQSPIQHIGILLLMGAFLSMFINNVGALALLMPVALHSIRGTSLTPSHILMPLAFGTILGGMATLIGTPPNIIISTYRERILGSGYEMFDFFPVGGLVALTGIGFMATLGWRFLKARTSSTRKLLSIESYVFEVTLAGNSPLLGKTINDLDDILSQYQIIIAALIHKNQKFLIPPRHHLLDKDDILILEGTHIEVDRFVTKYHLEWSGTGNASQHLLNDPYSQTLECVVSTQSPLIGETVEQAQLKYMYGVNVLAVSRQGQPHRGKIRSMRFQIGDVLLLHGAEEDIQDIAQRLHCLPLATQSIRFGHRKFGKHALAIFSGAILLTTFKICPLQVSFGLGVIAMVFFKIVPIRDLYEGIDWSIIFLIGTMIPLGHLLETTGTTRLISEFILNYVGTSSFPLVITILMIITMCLSDILNNSATAILMAPIAQNIAIVMDANPDPFLIAVAIGSSCAFLTPIGHQNNALVLGPGGYRFSDYWRIGLPLEILILLVAVPLITVFWPLQK